MLINRHFRSEMNCKCFSAKLKTVQIFLSKRADTPKDNVKEQTSEEDKLSAITSSGFSFKGRHTG